MSVARWPDIRDAVQAAIADAANLESGKVIWRWQNADAPPAPYVSLGFTGSRRVGQDYLEQSFSAAREIGEEIALVVRGVREVMLEIQCYTPSTVPGQEPSAPPGVPGLDGLGLGELISTSLLLPRIRDVLGAVGIVPFDPQPVQNIPSVVSAGFRGCGLLPVRCYAPAQAIAEYYGYITQVGGTITTRPDDRTWPFTATAPPDEE